jgi:hypothetical protein
LEEVLAIRLFPDNLFPGGLSAVVKLKDGRKEVKEGSEGSEVKEGNDGRTRRKVGSEGRK